MRAALPALAFDRHRTERHHRDDHARLEQKPRDYRTSVEGTGSVNCRESRHNDCDNSSHDQHRRGNEANTKRPGVLQIKKVLLPPSSYCSQQPGGAAQTWLMWCSSASQRRGGVHPHTPSPIKRSHAVSVRFREEAVRSDVPVGSLVGSSLCENP